MTTQQEIESCRYCEIAHVANLCVPGSEKRHPPWEPLRPVRLYFVSVAPSWGGDYLREESKGNDIREGLFKPLRSLSRLLNVCGNRKLGSGVFFSGVGRVQVAITCGGVGAGAARLPPIPIRPTTRNEG